ncbi:hypothetical protein [Actinoplanes sp. NPDC049681]|uniref:hypothetical protein n=1 Tax=Actinoplanes sp. NPDC049681 TaxID=3363905 RepID=UPI00379F8AAB
MRPNQMRRHACAAATLLLMLMLAAGCGGPADSTAGSAASSPVDGASATPAPEPSVPAEPSPTAEPTQTAVPPHHPSRSSSPRASRGDPDNPRDLVGPPIVLAGTVDAAGSCVVLVARGRRWALVGAPAGELTDGQTITVRGRPVAVPPGCEAEHGLAVRSVT